MHKANSDIFEMVKRKKLRLWFIADEIGMSDSSFSKLLRYPLSNEKRVAILAAIEKLSAERVVDNA